MIIYRVAPNILVAIKQDHDLVKSIEVACVSPHGDITSVCLDVPDSPARLMRPSDRTFWYTEKDDISSWVRTQPIIFNDLLSSLTTGVGGP